MASVQQSRRNRARVMGVVGVCGLMLGLAQGAAGQTSTWQNNLGGAWNVPGNWSPNIVPSGGSQTASIGVAGTYTVTLDLNNPSLGLLSLTNPNATLAIPAGYTFGVQNVTNNGLILLNSNAANSDATLRVDGPLTFSGTGTLRLNAGATDSISRAQVQRNGGWVPVNASGHTIRGAGYFNSCPLDNQGVVNADVSGSTLQFYNAGSLNSGTMKATGGGSLSLYYAGVTQTGGVILADGGTVRLDYAAGISGGTVSAVNGGVVQNSPGTSNSISGVTVTGPFHVREGSSLGVSAGLTNNGTITLNPSAINSDATVRFDSDVTLGGSGTLVLNAQTDAITRAQLVRNGNFTIQNSPTHTIRGTGIFNSMPITNAGLIQADVSGRALQLYNAASSNTATMRATAGGYLSFYYSSVTQTGAGQIVADGGTVGLDYGSTIFGGALTAVNGGVVQNSPGTANTVTGATVSGPFHVREGSTLAVHTALTNNGVMTLNPGGVNSDATLRYDSDMTLAGTGTLVLNAAVTDFFSRAQVQRGGAFVLTNAATHTIRGVGLFNSAGLNNLGTVRADVNSKPLQFYNAASANAGTMTATGGGYLSLYYAGLTQTGSGQLLADGGTIGLDYGTTVSGGAINAVNGGIVQNSPGTANTVTGATISGPFHVREGSTLAVHTALTNNGTITLNPNAANSDAVLRLDSDLTLAGTGTLLMNAIGADVYSRAQVQRSGAFALTIGPSQTLKGRGMFNSCPLVNNGTLTPGATAGATDFIQVYNSSLGLGATSFLDLQIGSPTAFDQIDCSYTGVTLGGTIKVRLVNGFVPPLGSGFNVISAVTGGSVTGSFSTVDIPPTRYNTRSWNLAILPNAVRVLISCPADYDGSGVINPSDVAAFVNAWFNSLSGGDLKADFDGNGTVSPADVAAFVSAWSASLSGSC